MLDQLAALLQRHVRHLHIERERKSYIRLFAYRKERKVVDEIAFLLLLYIRKRTGLLVYNVSMRIDPAGSLRHEVK